MIRRRQLHCVFDLFKCDTWTNIAERNGFAAEKNLILRECYLTLQQLAELQDGLLLKKVVKLEEVLLKHLLARQKEQSASNTRNGSTSNNKEDGDGNSASTMSVPLNECKLCKIVKYRCEVCNGKHGPQFFEFQITVGSTCQRCGMRAHNVCLRDRHKCTYLQSGRQHDLRLLE